MIHLGMKFRQAPAKIMKEDGADFATVEDHLASSGVTRSNAVQNGCGVLKKLFSFCSFHSNAAVLNAKITATQCDTFFCLRDVCERSDYRPMCR